jgi:hypothetical protein
MYCQKENCNGKLDVWDTRNKSSEERKLPMFIKELGDNQLVFRRRKCRDCGNQTRTVEFNVDILFQLQESIRKRVVSMLKNKLDELKIS